MPAAKAYRATTKGRFNVDIQTPSGQMVKDNNWKKQANPEANLHQLKRDERDKQLLLKRRNERIQKERNLDLEIQKVNQGVVVISDFS